MRSRNSERGITMAEVMVVVAISAIIASGTILSANNSAEKLPTTRRVIVSALNQAVSIASATGNGATVLFTPNTTQTQVQVYAGRPNGLTPNAALTTLVHTSTAPLGIKTAGQNLTSTVSGPSFAVFVNGFGQASYGAWSGPGAASTSPACLVSGAKLVLTIAAPASPAAQQTLQLSCGGSSFTAYDASGVEMPDLSASQQ